MANRQNLPRPRVRMVPDNSGTVHCDGDVDRADGAGGVGKLTHEQANLLEEAPREADLDEKHKGDTEAYRWWAGWLRKRGKK